MRVQTWIRTHKAHKSLYVHKSLVSFSIALFLPLYIYPKYKRVLERTMSFVQSAFLLQSMFDQDLIIFTSLSLPHLCVTSTYIYFPCVCLSTQNSQSSLRNICVFSPSLSRRGPLIQFSSSSLCTQPIYVVSVCSVHKVSKPNNKLNLS